MAPVVEVARGKVTLVGDDADLVQSFKRTDEALRRNRRALNNARRTFRRFGNQVTETAKRLTSVRTIVAGLFGGGLIGAGINNLAKDLLALQSRATQLRSTAEELQGLEFIGLDAGLDLDTITQSVVDYNDRLGDAIDGNETFRASFAAVGIDIRTANQGVRGFLEFLNAVNTLPDNATRLFRINEVLGDAGTRLLTLENATQQYSNALKENIVLTNEEVKAAAELGSTIAKTSQNIQNLFRSALASSADEIRRLLENLTPTREQMEQFVQSIVSIVDNLDVFLNLLKAIVAIKLAAFLSSSIKGLISFSGALAALVPVLRGASVTAGIFFGSIRLLLGATGFGALFLVGLTVVENFDKIAKAMSGITEIPIIKFIRDLVDGFLEASKATLDYLGILDLFRQKSVEQIRLSIRESEEAIVSFTDEIIKLEDQIEEIQNSGLRGIALQSNVTAIQNEISRISKLRDEEIVRLRGFKDEYISIMKTLATSAKATAEDVSDATKVLITQGTLDHSATIRNNRILRIIKSQRDEIRRTADEARQLQQAPASESLPFLQAEELRKATDQINKAFEEQRSLYHEQQRRLGNINDRIADSFGDLARGIAGDFDNIKDVARRFVLDLRNILLDELVFAPVRRYFRELLRDITGEGQRSAPGGGLFGGLGNFIRGLVPGLQTGGIGRGLTIVGERGPELVDFRSPARVYNSGDTQNILNSTPTIVVNNTFQARDLVGAADIMHTYGPEISRITEERILRNFSRNSPFLLAAKGAR